MSTRQHDPPGDPTTAALADRIGQTYGDRIYPDELVDGVRKFAFLVDEAIPQRAIDWLMSQPACLEKRYTQKHDSNVWRCSEDIHGSNTRTDNEYGKNLLGP